MLALPLLAVMGHVALTWTAYNRISPMSITIGTGSTGTSVARAIERGDALSSYLTDPLGAMATIAGYFLDQKEGLLVYGPYYLLAAVGMAWMWRRRRIELITLVVIFFSYVGPISLSQVSGYWGPPQRWMLGGLWPLVVLAALGLGLPVDASTEGRWLRRSRGVLLAVTALVTLVLLGTPDLAYNDLGIERSLLLQHYGAPGLPLWRAFPVWFRYGEPQWLATWLWLLAMAGASGVLYRWGSRALSAAPEVRAERPTPGAAAAEDNPDEPCSVLGVEGLRAAAVTSAFAAALFLTHHALVPVSAPALNDVRDYGAIRVIVPRRPSVRVWSQPSSLWSGGSDEVTIVISTARPLESLELSVTAIDPMPALIGIGDSRARLDLDGRGTRRVLLSPSGGVGTRWQTRWHYPLHIRSGGSSLASKLPNNESDTRVLGVNVRFGPATLSPRRDR